MKKKKIIQKHHKNSQHTNPYMSDCSSSSQDPPPASPVQPEQRPQQQQQSHHHHLQQHKHDHQPESVKILRNNLRKVLVSSPIASAPSNLLAASNKNNNNSLSELSSHQTKTKKTSDTFDQKQENKKEDHHHQQQNPIKASSLTPEDFAKLTPEEREDLKNRVHNYTKITSTLAVSPKRQTSNWHGTYLEPFCDHHNSALHPSPGPGEYQIDAFYKKKSSNNNLTTSENNNKEHGDGSSATRTTESTILFPTLGGKYADDVAARHLSPAATKYQKLQDISTIEVNVQGVKKRVVAKDSSSSSPSLSSPQTVTHLRNSNIHQNDGASTIVSASALIQNNLPPSPWRQEQERQHRELMAKLKQESKENNQHREKEKTGNLSPAQEREKLRIDFLRRSVLDKKNHHHSEQEKPQQQGGTTMTVPSSEAFQRILREEKEKKELAANSPKSTTKGFSMMSSRGGNFGNANAPGQPLSEVSYFSGPGYYEVPHSTIHGKSLHQGARKAGGTINVPLVRQ